ncbi:MAG: hypothetical protein ACYDDN_03830 [Candidatus Desulforudaceae bacterium]
MTHDFIEHADGTATIQIDFGDEGVELTGETNVKGGLDAAQRYLPTFEADLRSNFADRFPVPEPESGEGGEE